MSYFRVVSIVLGGLLVMVISGLGGYFWASQPTDRQNVKQTKQKPSPQNDSSDFVNGDQSMDTEELTPQNWEAFLRYEGERRQMLGINKKYNSVNFRKGPGTTYSLRKTPKGGTLLMPIDRISNWFRARTRDGKIGWIHKSVVRQLEVPLPIYNQFQKDLPPLKKSTKELIPKEFKKHNRVRVLESKVNLRQGPGEQFAIAGRIYKHEEVRLFGKKNNWFRVKTFNGLLGWARADLVEIVWKIPPQEQKTIRVKNTDPRMAPEYQFSQSETQQEPVQAKLLEVQYPWALVKIDDKTIGWVLRKEVTESFQSLIEQSADRARPPQRPTSSTVPRRPQRETPNRQGVQE